MGHACAREILAYLFYTTIFSAATVMLVKYSTAEKFSRWYFSIFFVPYGLPKLIVVDADGVFSGFFRQKNQKFYRSQFTQWHKKS